jgi:hypothetical protein
VRISLFPFPPFLSFPFIYVLALDLVLTVHVRFDPIDRDFETESGA